MRGDGATFRALAVASIALGACGFTSQPAAVVVVIDDAGTPGSGSDATASPIGDTNGDEPAPGIPDAAPVPIPLVETATDVVTPGSSVVCYSPGAQSTSDGTWRRVFRLTDFGISGALEVTSVSFAADHARNANGVVVRVGAYSGAFGGTTLDESAITAIATASVNVPDDESPQQVVVPIAATIPTGGVFVVEIAAPSLRGVGRFNLGATSAGETAPGYFSSTACSFLPPESTTMLGGVGHLVIGVTGVRQ